MVKIFYKKFYKDIRVKFNWERFLVEEWPIVVISFYERKAFSALKLPWYIGESDIVMFDALDASPVVLGNIEDWYPKLPKKQRAVIDEMKQKYLCDSRPPEFEFPVYALPKSEYMVMDHCHRLSAIALAGVSFSLNMWVVNGPIDDSALADLTHVVRTQRER